MPETVFSRMSALGSSVNSARSRSYAGGHGPLGPGPGGFPGITPLCNWENRGISYPSPRRKNKVLTQRCATIQPINRIFVRCNYSLTTSTEVEGTMRDPRLAAVLSLLIPGVGQLYNGRILAGILWLIITPGLWIGTGGLLGWICHLIAAYTAYTYARDHLVRRSAQIRGSVDRLYISDRSR
jgi:hypothetical protein